MYNVLSRSVQIRYNTLVSKQLKIQTGGDHGQHTVRVHRPKAGNKR